MMTMTRNTNRRNIKPMLFFIAVPVVVLLGGLWAVMAELCIGAGQFADFNSIINGTYCLSSFGMLPVIFLVGLC